MKAKSLHVAVRTSLENFARIVIDGQHEAVINMIPLYAISNYREYLSKV